MSSTLQNNKDKFSVQIQEKLRNLEVQPDPQLWLNISNRLNYKSSRKLWIFYTSAASFLLLISFFLFHNTVDEKLVTLVTENTPPVENINTSMSQTKDILEEHKAASFPQNHKFISKNSSSKPNAIESTKSEPLAEVESLKKEQTTSQQFNEAVSLDHNESKPQVKVQAESSNTKQVFELPKSNDNEFKAKTAEKPSWGLKMSASSGAMALNTSIQSAPRMKLISNPALINDIQTYVPGTDEFAKRHYALPLSYNALIEKSITNKISVESGVSFTSLVTVFSEYKWGDIDASLRLYYIGLPLQFNYQIAKFDKSSIGLTAGVLMEKGLQSVYTQNVYYTGSTYFTRVKESIDGYQFSAKLGGDYSFELLPDFDFYFSPSLQYFPDNNQPMSIRREMPLQLNLQLGVKYNI